MMSQAGFFIFRWLPMQAEAASDEIAVVFKIPGATDVSVLPDLIESVCIGPIVPSAIVMLQLGNDGLDDALRESNIKNSLRRFSGRMPLMVFTITPHPYALTLAMEQGAPRQLQEYFTQQFADTTIWINAGLASIFDSNAIVVCAPSGYTFLKPSGERATYFIRAELALSKSPAVTFVAFAIFYRLLRSYGGIPQELRLLLVDTMNIAPIAFALREMLSRAGVKLVPQIESFHSYGGLDQVSRPLPGTSLCIVSASSTMNLQRKWIREKALSIHDIVTLVTFKDAPDSEYALYRLAADARPAPSLPTSTYDICIEGEYFFPVMEKSRKVLLSTTHHGCKSITDHFYELHGRHLFSSYRSAVPSGTRRSLYIDAEVLLKTEEFQNWINDSVPLFLRAGTVQVIYQDDDGSATLAQHIAHIATEMGCAGVKVINAAATLQSIIDKQAPLVCVATLVGNGSALLSLCRELRNCHFGSRLYLIGMQVTQSVAKLEAFDRNLKHSSRKMPNEVLRWKYFLSSDVVTESFQQELSIYQSGGRLEQRMEELQRGLNSERLFLPSGPEISDSLILNEDFAFWSGQYSPAAYQAEVPGTFSTILQNARTSKLQSPEHQLHSPRLMHVALDPENFARFNEGIIHAALLRAALPSELDFRGDVQGSAYMLTLLRRIATKFDEPQVATLEFLSAIATLRLQLTPNDTLAVKCVFESEAKKKANKMSAAVCIFLRAFPSQASRRQAF